MSWLNRFQRWVTASALKIYVLLVLFSIVPLLLFLYSADRLLRTSSERRLFQQGGDVGNLVASLFEQQFGDSKNLLQSVAMRRSLVDSWQRGDMEDVGRHLQQTHELAPNFRFISVYDTAGTLRGIYPPDPTVLNKNYAFRDWYKGVSSGWRPYVSNLYETAVVPKQLVVAVAVPIRDESGRPIGILMAPYSAQTIQSWERFLPRGTARFIEIVDRAGNVVVGNPATTQSGSAHGEFEPVRRALAGQSGSGTFSASGAQVQAVYRHLPSIGWGLIIAVPINDIRGAIWQFERPLIGLALLFILVAMVFGSISAALSRQLRLSENELQQKNLELDLRNREVERANQMKSRFLASMSHELRTPLNAILGFSELLSDTGIGPLTEKQIRWVEHIRRSGKHLLQLINDILDLAKIEAGQVELAIESFEVMTAVPEVISNTRPLAMAKQIRLVLDCAPHLRIRADRLRFKQVLYNLLSNAVKFTPQGGEVCLMAKQGDNVADFTVVDTGVGIRAEDLEVIFDEFRQVGDEATMKEGTGLGLAITRRLIEQQGGKIRAESQLGSGTQMRFTLPLAESEPLGAPIALPVSVQHHDGPLILIVDDDPSACELLANYLDPEGYAIASAHSGREAVEMAARLRPAAITLDILMSSGSGWETLYGLRNDPATQQIPVIVVSVVDQKKLGATLGAADYLVKPVEREVLLQTIARHLRTAGGGRLSCVAADDEPEALRLMADVLGQAGCTVRLARNGTEALAQLKAGRTDLLLLDLVMPDMDGFEVIRQMEADPDLRNIPIVVITAKELTQAEIDHLSRTTRELLDKDGSWRTRLLDTVKRFARPSSTTARADRA